MRFATDVTDLMRAAGMLNGASDRIRQAAAQAAYAFGADVVRTGVEQYRSAPDTTDTATRRRTGMLARSLAHRVDRSTTGVELTIGYLRTGLDDAALQYAAMQEYGGVLPEKASGYYTIPLPGALTASGVARGTARDFDNTFVIPNRSGKGLTLMQRRPGEDPLALFFLTHGPIKIRARPSLKPSVTPKLPAFRDRLRAIAQQALWAN